MSPDPTLKAKLWVTLKVSGVGVLVAVAMVVIVEAKANKIRHSISKAFGFKLSPPFCFFILELCIWEWKGKKLYGV